MKWFRLALRCDRLATWNIEAIVVLFSRWYPVIASKDPLCDPTQGLLLRLPLSLRESSDGNLYQEGIAVQVEIIVRV